MKKILLPVAALLTIAGIAAENPYLKTNKQVAQEDALYRSFRQEDIAKVPENIEWSICYAYNTTDRKNPRLLIIGDSICNMYAAHVKNELKGKMNLTYFVTSKCVTSTDFLRELSLQVHARKADVISFNNGLHTNMKTPVENYEKCYRAAVNLIRAAQPEAKLFLTLSTPLKDPKKTEYVKKLNAAVWKIAKEKGLGVMDLFTPMDKLDRNKYWSDTYHFKPEMRIVQGKLISARAWSELPESKKTGNVNSVESATGPSGKIR